MGHKQDIMCRYFLRGNCSYGKHCKFKHVNKDASTESFNQTQHVHFRTGKNEQVKYGNPVQRNNKQVSSMNSVQTFQIVISCIMKYANSKSGVIRETIAGLFT